MKIKPVVLVAPVLLLSSVLFAQQPSSPASTPAPSLGPSAQAGPLTEKDVITELKKKTASDQLLKDLSTRGVNFEMDAETEKRLRKAKATDEIIKAVAGAGPKERVAAQKSAALANGQTLIPQEESADFKVLENETDPDKAIAEAEAYVKKFPKTEALSYIYAFEAHGYEAKGDAEKLVEYADRSLAIKKDNLMSLLMAAYAIPQPQFVKKHQADEEKQLDKAVGYTEEALKDIDALKKLPDETDADFTKRKNGYSSNIHADLGMIHLDRAQLGLMSVDTAELVKAEGEYKQAISLSDHPDPTDYYRLAEAYRLEGKADDAIGAFTKASELGQGVLKQYAEQQIEALKKAKTPAGGGTAKP